MKKGINSAAITCTFQTSKQEHFVVKSLLTSVRGLSFEHACIARDQISFHMHSFQNETEAANNAVFSFHSR